MLKNIKNDLAKSADPEKAKLLARFFKTGPGEYGEGDEFLGIVVPQQRIIVKKYAESASLADLQNLLDSKIHECRLTALLILVNKYQRASKQNNNRTIKQYNNYRGKQKESVNRKEIFQFYLKNTKNINNWDLVDLSAPNIVGNYLLSQDRKILYQLVKSKNLWERRIAVLATFAFIREHQFEDAIKIAKLLLADKHDLIHKAVGWMLREAGKRDLKILTNFLDENSKIMPRTMLRYAIEKLPETRRKHYLKK